MVLKGFERLAGKLQVPKIAVLVGPKTVTTKFSLDCAAAVFLMTLAIAPVSPAQQIDSSPPEELLQFVHEAKRNGVKDDQIKKQAILVGWKAGLVDQAIAYEKSSKNFKQPEPATAAVTPAKSEPAKVEPAKDEAAAGSGTNSVEKTPAGGANVAVSRVLNIPDEYQIAPGDTLQIAVWNHSEVSVPSEIVRPDGKITVPLIKDVEVAGLTPREIEKTVADRMSKFYTDANVTVVIAAMGPKKIYLTGGVRKEGPVVFTYGMTVMQAISEAGGLTDYAKRKKIYILRTENGREYRLDFNYDEVIKGVRMEQNYVLAPGDTIVVPN